MHFLSRISLAAGQREDAAGSVDGTYGLSADEGEPEEAFTREDFSVFWMLQDSAVTITQIIEILAFESDFIEFVLE